MIQRIQSLWLLLGATAFGLTGLFNVVTHEITASGTNLFTEKVIFTVFNTSYSRSAPDTYFSSHNNMVIGVLVFAAAIFALANIFQFKSRAIQIKVCNFILFIAVAIIGLLIVYTFRTKSIIHSPAESVYGIAYFFPVAGLAFTMLAKKAIQKDEELIKSVDRIR